MKNSTTESQCHCPRRRYGAGSHLLLTGVTAVAIIGVAIGYYSSPPGNRDSTQSARLPNEPPSRSEPSVVQSYGYVANIQRFALSESDMSDSIEAPALAITTSGDVVLAWATETGPAERKVMLTKSTDGGQSFAVPEAKVTTGIHTSVSQMRGREITRKMRTLPHLASADDTLYLAWVDAAGTRDSVVLSLATSEDGGQRFSDPVPVHQSRDARPTFTSLHVSDDQTVVCSWLDNRNRVQQPFAAVRRPGSQKFEPEKMVYAGPDGQGICPCCPTMAIVSGSDILVTFRGNEGGYRDMWTARMEAGADQFAPPIAAVSPTWKFAGCPHDGPSVCETSRGLHVAWMDSHDGAERVYVGAPAGDKPPTAIGDTTDHATTLGHPDLIAHGDVLHLVWDQSLAASADVPVDVGANDPKSNDDHSHSSAGHERNRGQSHSSHQKEPARGRAIYYAQSHDGGQTFSAAIAVAPADAHFQTRPRIRISSTGTPVVAWMELAQSGKSVVVATLRSSTNKVPTQMTSFGAHE
jgi:hypothetical protein